MKCFIAFLVLFSVNIWAESIAVIEPDSAAPYGLTWEQYASILEEGADEVYEDLEAEYLELATMSHEEREGIMNMARILSEQTRDYDNTVAINESLRKQFCEVLDIPDIEDSEKAQLAWIGFPEIVRHSVKLSYQSRRIDLSKEWMVEQYPTVWVVLNGFIYCGSFYEGRYLQRPPG